MLTLVDGLELVDVLNVSQIMNKKTNIFIDPDRQTAEA